MFSQKTSKKFFIVQAVSLLLSIAFLLSGCSDPASNISVEELKNSINDYYDSSIVIGDISTKKNDDGYGFSYMTYGSGYTYTYFGQANDSMKVKNVTIMVTKTIDKFNFNDVDSMEEAMTSKSDLPTATFVLSVCALYKVLGNFDTKSSFREVEQDIVNNSSKSMDGWSFTIKATDNNATIEAVYKG